MSYDYVVFRTKSPIRCLNETGDGSVVVAGSWLEEADEILRREFGELHWSREGERVVGDGLHLGIGRFEVSADFERGYTMVHVQGSHHANQTSLVRKIAQALSATAFDVQTGEAL